jgi:endogenous inhibitor of DNA gyrase (YacG/DUF329 family)
MISVRCPICDRVMQGASTAEWPDFPFCSDRCRLVDLGRWLGESYAIRITDESDEETSPSHDEHRNP